MKSKLSNRYVHSAAHYTHDGNKNVSEVVAADCTIAAHYEYAPFGALTVSRGESSASNPFRFSSEYAEDDTATVYYNYRHYEPVMGRWLGRDPAEEDSSVSLYSLVNNFIGLVTDALGLSSVTGYVPHYALPGRDPLPMEYTPIDKPKSNCPCGRDLVYVADSENKDRAERMGRLGLYVTGSEYKSFRHASEFDPNSSLKEGECVCSLLVIMHGDADEGAAFAGPRTEMQEDRDHNAISSMFDGVRYCEDCTIELRSCKLALYPTLLKRIADLTRCTVKGYKTGVSPWGMYTFLASSVTVKPNSSNTRGGL